MTNGVKYHSLLFIKKATAIATLLTNCAITVNAQNSNSSKDSSGKKNILSYYHSFAPAKVAHPFQHIDYTRPNDQIMSWPDYPLTPTEIERRHRVAEQKNNVASVIAKDIITGILKKKTKVAVIPKF